MRQRRQHVREGRDQDATISEKAATMTRTVRQGRDHERQGREEDTTMCAKDAMMSAKNTKCAPSA